MKYVLYFLFLTFVANAQNASDGYREIIWENQVWVTHDPEAKVLEDSSLYLKKGIIWLKDENLEAGRIEVDIKATHQRSFAGLIFNLNDSLFHYNEVYLRNHKSGNPDAIQYTPVYYEFNNWQLYPEYQQTAQFASDGWNHLSVEFDDQFIRIYLNKNEEPLLVTPNEIRGSIGTKIGIEALMGAHFRDFRFQPANSNPTPLKQEWEKNEKSQTLSGVIRNWSLGSIHTGSPDFKTIPTNDTWKSVITDNDGLLPISKYVKKSTANQFDQNPLEYVWVKTVLETDRNGWIPLFFEYSDKILIVKDGIPLFEGDNSFRKKGSLFRGDIDKTISSNGVFVPVQEGENVIYFGVSAKANGWGLMAKKGDLIPKQHQ